jgi:hypothetical protein
LAEKKQKEETKLWNPECFSIPHATIH